MRTKASSHSKFASIAGFRPPMLLMLGMITFVLSQPLAAADTDESCAAKAEIKHRAESSNFFLAHSRFIAGTVASNAIIVPVGVIEAVAWIPPILVAHSLACSPALILDIAMRNSGSMTSFCFAIVPQFVTIPDLYLTSYLQRETIGMRRVDIARIVNDRMATADCYSSDAEPGAGAIENQEAAYAELEKMILDDRYYKKLTPAQLDEVDSRLRSLKAKLSEIAVKKQSSDI